MADEPVRIPTPLNSILFIFFEFAGMIFSVDRFYTMDPSGRNTAQWIAYTANRGALHSRRMFC